MIEIVIADDQGMMRTLLTEVCSAGQDMTVVGAVATGEEAIELVQATRPDVAVIDVKLPGISGLEVTRRLSRQLPEVRVIVLTALDDSGFAARALLAGARGFVTKQAVAKELVAAIRAVHARREYLDSAVAQKVALGHLRQEGSPIDKLRDREVDVLLLMLRGQIAAEISATLDMSPNTVEHHRRAIRLKFNVTTDAQLGVVAARYGLDPLLKGAVLVGV